MKVILRPTYSNVLKQESFPNFIRILKYRTFWSN